MHFHWQLRGFCSKKNDQLIVHICKINYYKFLNVNIYTNYWYTGAATTTTHSGMSGGKLERLLLQRLLPQLLQQLQLLLLGLLLLTVA